MYTCRFGTYNMYYPPIAMALNIRASHNDEANDIVFEKSTDQDRQ